jgi:hypothetical protein
VLKESCLHGMQVVSFCESFNCRDFLAIMNDSEGKATINTAAICQDCAGTALAMIATLLRTSQHKILAKKIEKSDPRINNESMGPAVYYQFQVDRDARSF